MFFKKTLFPCVYSPPLTSQHAADFLSKLGCVSTERLTFHNCKVRMFVALARNASASWFGMPRSYRTHRATGPMSMPLTNNPAWRSSQISAAPTPRFDRQIEHGVRHRRDAINFFFFFSFSNQSRLPRHHVRAPSTCKCNGPQHDEPAGARDSIYSRAGPPSP